MARTLTKKQRGFVNKYADTGNASLSVKENYDVTTDGAARVLGSRLLTSDNIQKELKKLGFDSNNAKRVISEILNDESLEPKDRIKAAENVFKVHGDYAPEKQINLNIESTPSEDMIQYANALLGQQKAA